ncbi:MAG: FHA domain-containing protein, partial [Blastocatellia bacterium]
MTSSDKPLVGTFRVIAGPDQQREFDLDPLSRKKRLSFGRHHSCDYVLGHPTVSREHFALELSGPRLLLVDSLSGNGTFVNGDRVTWVELKSGDRVQAGPFVMIATLVDDSGSNAAGEPEESGPSYSNLDPAGAYRLEHELVYPRQYLTGIVEFNQGKY